MNLIQLMTIVANVDSTIQFLREKKLLSSNVHCCDELCKIVKDKGTDGQIFRCVRCRRKSSIRKGSFFSKSKLKLQHLLLLLYFFVTGSPVKDVSKFLASDVSREACLQWYIFLREICSSYLLHSDDVRLGSEPNSAVHIDECFMGGLRKYNRGAQRGTRNILFGLVDSVSKKCMVVLVPDRSHASLIPIIEKYVVPGATIHSDEAAVYKCLSRRGFVHKTVKHKDEFVTADGVHTNQIENLWSNLKSHNKQLRGSNVRHISLHVDEWVYKWNRKRDIGDIFDLFIADIGIFYKV